MCWALPEIARCRAAPAGGRAKGGSPLTERRLTGSPIDRSGRVVTLRSERRGDDKLNLWAYLDEEGSLHLDGQDLGPGTAPVSDDGEYEYFKVVAADDVPRVVALLGGKPGEGVLDLLERNWTGERSWELERRLREGDIPVHLHVWS